MDERPAADRPEPAATARRGVARTAAARFELLPDRVPAVPAATGCRARTCMRCTTRTASQSATSRRSSSRATRPASSSASASATSPTVTAARGSARYVSARASRARRALETLLLHRRSARGPSRAPPILLSLGLRGAHLRNGADVLLYIVACCTKHVNSYSCLLFGRLLGGVSTSLLLTVFDAWLACEHRVRGFEPELLQRICGAQTFGNSLVAIGAGVIAQALVGRFPLLRWGDGAAARSDGSELEQVFEDAHEPGVYFGGLTAPFDLAVIALACGGVCSSRSGRRTTGTALAPPMPPSDTPRRPPPPPAPRTQPATADAAAVTAVEPLLLAAKASSRRWRSQRPSTRRRPQPRSPRRRGAARSPTRSRVAPGARSRPCAATRASRSRARCSRSSRARCTPSSLVGRPRSRPPPTHATAMTPAEPPSAGGIPHGTVFATFMLCCMAGSQLHAPLLAACGGRPERVLVRVCAAGALGLGVAALQSEPGSALACVRFRRSVTRARRFRARPCFRSAVLLRS